jgi:TrmH family RNA methyltransferase
LTKWKRLHTGKRVKYNQLIVEGVRSIIDITAVYTNGSKSSSSTNGSPAKQQIFPVAVVGYEDMVEEIEAVIKTNHTEVYRLSRDDPQSAAIVKQLSNTLSSSGIFAIYDTPAPSQPPSQPPSPTPSSFYLISDGIQDPGNFGTLIRSYLACTFTGGILSLPPTVDHWNSKIIRSSMGAVGFGVEVTKLDTIQTLIQFMDGTFGSNNWTIACATLGEASSYSSSSSSPQALPQSTPYHTTPLAETRALLLGNEGHGISLAVQKLLAKGDERFITTHVPMGNGVESLNVGVAGSILLFETAKAKQLL